MSLVYFLSKFSQELILIELFLIGCILTLYFGFLLTKKRKYGIAKSQIPDTVVKAFLIEILGNAEGFKNQLFGEDFKIEAKNSGLQMPTGASAGDSADLSGIKSQLLQALTKQEEFSKLLQQAQKDKADLEAKLAAGGGGATAGPTDKALQDKLSKLEEKLAEYEVIEDDLANLKRYQQENKKLKEQLQSAGIAAPTADAAPAAATDATATAATPAADEPAPTPVAEATPTAEAAPAHAEQAPAAEPAVAAQASTASPIAAAEEAATAATANKEFEGMVDKIEESLTKPAQPAGASVQDPMAAAPPAAEAPASDANKSDADLLNEFERMLNS